MKKNVKKIIAMVMMATCLISVGANAETKNIDNGISGLGWYEQCLQELLNKTNNEVSWDDIGFIVNNKFNNNDEINSERYQRIKQTLQKYDIGIEVIKYTPQPRYDYGYLGGTPNINVAEKKWYTPAPYCSYDVIYNVSKENIQPETKTSLDNIVEEKYLLNL